jgi:hypothetical protein
MNGPTLSTIGTRLVAAGLLGAVLAGCGHAAHPTPAGSAATVPPTPSPAASPPAATPADPSAAASAPGGTTPTPTHARRIGPADAGHDVAVRYGDLVQVVPPTRPGGWRVTGYPKAILRPQTSTGPAAEHAFLAIAVGGGDVVLTPAGGGDPFTVHVRVLRDMIATPPA